MTYEVQFKIGDAEYTVRGPDTVGILALIDGLQPKGATRCQDAAETTLKRMGYTWNGGVLWRPPIGPAPAFEETPLPPLEQPEQGWIPMDGNIRPVRAHAKVEVQFKSGICYGPLHAHAVAWDKVMAYRLMGREVPPADDDWIEWAGGDCPVSQGTSVQLRGKDGKSVVTRADEVEWRSPEITAYRVLKPFAG